ncbi:MAG: 5-formyltetrahydrofolate cyclo-ligase [Halieaceae bacterium]|jgi:5-formyltetrahydrofolate cyclo-ligase
MSTAEINIATRRALKRRRRALSTWRQRVAAKAVYRHIASSSMFRNSHSVAAYCAGGGELDVSAVISRLLQQCGHCYLPVSGDAGSMVFASHRPGQTLGTNRFGLLEPRGCYQVIQADRLDLVLVPLVAFDRHGGRLGMGGGFYDRCFAFKQGRPLSRPLLLGVAHDFQLTSRLTAQEWDVRLDAVVTPSGLRLFP